MDVDRGAVPLHLPFPGVIRRQEINSRLFVSFELYGRSRELLQSLISHTRFVQLLAVLVDPLQLVPADEHGVHTLVSTREGRPVLWIAERPRIQLPRNAQHRTRLPGQVAPELQILPTRIPPLVALGNR